MSISLYDEALTQKIQNWIKDPNLKIYSPSDTSELLRQRADINNDKPIQLPFIALSRDTSIEILNVNNGTLSKNGATLYLDEKKAITLEAIPIKLSYHLDIYTKTVEDADDYIRDFVFMFVTKPSVIITIPYNGINYEHESNLYLDNIIEDGSDIPEHLAYTQFHRYILKFEIDDAYLFSAPINASSVIEETETKTST